MTPFTSAVADYLTALALGTSGVDLLEDTIIDTPSDLTVIYDMGGHAMGSSLAPDNWRDMYVQVRSEAHDVGQSKVWNILNAILYPTTASGLIEQDGNLYVAQLLEIPTVVDRDNQNRYLFGFRFTLQLVIEIHDRWLDGLTTWAQGILGSGWTVYKGYPGSKRPCLVWHLNEYSVKDIGAATYETTKHIMGVVHGVTPADQINAVSSIMVALAQAPKLKITDATGVFFLTKRAAQSTSRPGDIASSMISVTFSRRDNKPTTDAPLIGTVTIGGTIS